MLTLVSFKSLKRTGHSMVGNVGGEERGKNAGKITVKYP